MAQPQTGWRTNAHRRPGKTATRPHSTNLAYLLRLRVQSMIGSGMCGFQTKVTCSDLLTFVQTCQLEILLTFCFLVHCSDMTIGSTSTKTSRLYVWLATSPAYPECSVSWGTTTCALYGEAQYAFSSSFPLCLPARRLSKHGFGCFRIQKSSGYKTLVASTSGSVFAAKSGELCFAFSWRTSRGTPCFTTFRTSYTPERTLR